MNVTWLGQAGLLLKSGGMTVMIDPYLSDSVAAVEMKNTRRFPVDEWVFTEKPNVMLFTHNHLDHYDPETVARFITPDTRMTVLAPSTVWPTVRQIGGDNNFVLFDRGTVWTEGPFRFTAVPAQHSDAAAIGVIVEAEGKAHYITGDTLYAEHIFPALPGRIDTVFLPVNGAGNNMNMTDAAAFVARCGAKTAVPLHIGLFDNLQGEAFPCENKRLLPLFEEVML